MAKRESESEVREYFDLLVLVVGLVLDFWMLVLGLVEDLELVEDFEHVEELNALASSWSS